MADAKILEKGLKLLEELAQSAEGKSAVELAELLGIHKTSVYRYLNTLLEMGYIRTDGNGAYHLGNKILELGSHMLRRMPLREVAHPFLVKLSAETQKTVHLCVLDGAEVVYLDKVESQRSLPIISRIGSRAPAYCTGVGKALLSTLPTDQVLELLKRTPLVKRTENTITDPMKLLDELKLTRERGYAIDDGEHEEGIKCFAAIIKGYGGETVGAISITGLKREFDVTKTAKGLITALKGISAEVSSHLGGTIS
jgi:DNA-binding IclR family transcriptional regulator